LTTSDAPAESRRSVARAESQPRTTVTLHAPLRVLINALQLVTRHSVVLVSEESSGPLPSP